MPIVNRTYIYNNIQICFRHLDSDGRVFNLHLFDWAGAAREAYLTEVVKNYHEVIQRPILWITTRMSQEVCGVAGFGDMVEVRMTCERIRKMSFVLALKTYNLTREQMLAQGEQTTAFVNAKTGAVQEIPEEVVEAIRQIEKR